MTVALCLLTTLLLGGIGISQAQMLGQPANSYVAGSNWYCKSGYQKTGNKCVSIFAGKSIENGSTSSSSFSSSSPSLCAENGSCYGDISKNTGRQKTVPVRGYYRKDGTYVRGHYRSKK